MIDRLRSITVVCLPAVLVLSLAWPGTRAVVAAEKPPELVLQTGHSHEITSMALCADGKFLLTGAVDQTAILWDVERGTQLRTFAGHRKRINGVALSADGQVALTGSDD